ncbi:MAG: ATP-binding protein [Candidatus Aenigmarchaeota archaeon]|nr:ATP-binding protein [Candidatus Aenigmarchaeota archaeon]
MKYVITGGPGVGKTTTLNELEKLGYSTLPEVARQIIAEQMPNGVLPWTNLFAFQKLVVTRQLDLESKVEGVTFLDRGLLDGLAYCWAGGIDVPLQLSHACRNAEYAGVFLLDRLPAYCTDAQRKESVEEAEKIHNALAEAYITHSYTPIRVPVLPPEERAKYILERIGGDRNGRML